MSLPFQNVAGHPSKRDKNKGATVVAIVKGMYIQKNSFDDYLFEIELTFILFCYMSVPFKSDRLFR